MERPIHFEIQADNLARAEKFYTAVFGWTFSKFPMADGNHYLAIMTAPMDSKEPGINGGLVQRPVKAPALEQGTNAFVVTVKVNDYDATEKKILKAGGQIALPKFAIAGMAWQGYYIDTEGNTFGIHQVDEKAK